MKNIILAVFMVFIISTGVDAFLYEIEMKTVEEIQQLTEKDLAEVYTEAKIEERASSEFHQSAGFSSTKEYELRKKLLRYIVDLRREMARREVEVEPIDEWLK